MLAAFVTLAAVGSRAPLLIPLGGGLLASALGGALFLGSFDVVARVLANLGELVAEPLTLALIAAVTPRRYTALVFALWMAWQRLWLAPASLGVAGAPAWVVAVGTLGCVAAGAALLARGRSIEASRFSAPGSAWIRINAKARRRKGAKRRRKEADFASGSLSEPAPGRRGSLSTLPRSFAAPPVAGRTFPPRWGRVKWSGTL